jgi:hypothetical protein
MSGVSCTGPNVAGTREEGSKDIPMTRLFETEVNEASVSEDSKEADEMRRIRRTSLPSFVGDRTCQREDP